MNGIGFQRTASSAMVSVVNGAPVIFAGAVSGMEGSPISISGTLFDPGGDTLEYSIDWGHGTTTPATTFVSADNRFQFSKPVPYANDGSYTATLTIDDNDGGVTTLDVEIIVENADPIQTATPSLATTNEDTPATDIDLTGFFSDVAADTIHIDSVDAVSALGASVILSGGLVTYDPTVSASLQALNVGDSADGHVYLCRC